MPSQPLKWFVLFLFTNLSFEFNLNTELFRKLNSFPPNTRAGHSVSFWTAENGKGIVVGAPRHTNRLFEGGPKFISGEVHICEHENEVCRTSFQRGLPVVSKRQEKNMTKASMKPFEKVGIGAGETIGLLRNGQSELLVCAPRYPKFRSYNTKDQPTKRQIQTRGICFSKTKFSQKFTAVNARIPDLIIKDGEKIMNSRLFDGYGQLGFSVAMRKEGNVFDTFFGLPNSYSERGSVVKESGNQLDGGACYPYLPEDKCPSLSNGYLGWSLEERRFSTEAVLAAGAPEALNKLGAVFFANKVLDYFPDASIAGADFASHFGVTLASGNFDGGGDFDLVVGAPFAYVQRPGEKKVQLDAGRVHIFYNPFTSRRVETLNGTERFGRFGSAILCPGDLDNNGFDDLLVGAPYTSEGGSVYLYNGYEDGLHTQPSQIITPKTFTLPIPLGVSHPEFGFSFGGNDDVDDNGYNDVVIGAPGLDLAVVLSGLGYGCKFTIFTARFCQQHLVLLVPIQVLTRPNVAYLRRSDGKRCFNVAKAVGLLFG